VKNRIGQCFDELIARLNVIVDRVSRRRGFDRKSLKFDDQLDRRTQANQEEHPPLASLSREAVPSCPVCGTIPHNCNIHEEWRHLFGAKSEDKVAADQQAYPAHECVDHPSLPCPTCLKWTGDAFAMPATMMTPSNAVT
jgi:hypothetical protein